MAVSPLSDALIKVSDELSGPTQHGSAAGRVYAGLRARIISMDLKPDTVLSRAEIGKDYGVSQSPVREAIQKLEQEGLVLTYPQSKTLVTKIDIDHARETQFLRLSIELEVARKLSELKNPDLLLSPTRILRMQNMAGEDRDIAEFTTLDRLFHMSLFQAAEISSLWHLISGRSGHIDRLRHLNLPDPGKLAAILESHQAILAAIAKGDTKLAQAQVRKHLSGTLKSIPTIMASYPDYFEDRKAK
ncbi:MAG: GntR family transcriptional regulator [Roseibium sp.]